MKTHLSLDQLLQSATSVEVLETISSLTPNTVLFILNEHDVVLFCNESIKTLLGVGTEDAIGKRYLALFDQYLPDLKPYVQSNPLILDQTLHANGSDSDVFALVRSTKELTTATGEPLGRIELLRITSKPAERSKSAAASESVESFHGLVSRDPAMKQAFTIIRNVAETEATVLVRGESGTGKELVARAIHAQSVRRDHPYLAINCAALTPTLLESQLFGHRRGAFTGAVTDHAGFFQRADKGTLFLDEVAELPLDLQAKLLRVLQDQRFIPVGAEQPMSVDVRIIAATHRSLRERVRKGAFREDLMYRLRVVPIFLPPLRERRQDIGLLLWHLIEQHNQLGLRRIETISPQAMRVLLDHSWPGNVRELQNVVEYAFAVGRDPELILAELPPEFREGSPRAVEPTADVIKPFGIGEKDRIIKALENAGGRIDAAAEILGMSRATFWRKRKKYQI